MSVTLPGGFWYPERPQLVAASPAAPLAVPAGDAVGNTFSLGAVRTAGVAFVVRLVGPVQIDLLDPAGAVLGTRTWPAAWQTLPASDPAHALTLEWPADVELAAGTRYRVVLTPAGATPVTVYDTPLVAGTPALGWKVTRTAGVWSEDATRAVAVGLRITGC